MILTVLMFVLLTGLAVCWGPLFHQIAADQFAREYLPHLTQEARDSFILGSVYIDGLRKKKSHDINWVVNLLNQYENNTNEWWFVMGFALHITVDMAGHVGAPITFLPQGRIWHYFSELTVCSSILHEKNPPKLHRTSVSDAVYQKSFGKSSRLFSSILGLWRWFCRFPLYRFLDLVESDTCAASCERGWAICNLEMHLRVIKGLMWDSLCILMNGRLTSEHIGSMVQKQMKTVKCCL